MWEERRRIDGTTYFYNNNQTGVDPCPDAACLILQSTLDARAPTAEGKKELDEKEQRASEFYTELLLDLYKSIPTEVLFQLPPPGELRRRRELSAVRFEHVLTRMLVQRELGADKGLRVTRCVTKRLRWIFCECPDELFALIVLSLKCR